MACAHRVSSLQIVVLFSCKISNSVLTFLDRHGEDLGSLYESAEWPAELLRDPAYWLDAGKMESLLAHLTESHGHAVPDSALSAEVGRQAVELRAWGALDSVLRLVQAPKDLFAQPERLLSYFISPAPPVGNVRREGDTISFEIPLDSSEYPLVVQYLRSAFEALPGYMGLPLATAQWQGSEVSIRWADSQRSLFGEAPAQQSRTLHPELVRNVMQNLEESQRRLEEAKTHLARKSEELATVRAQLRQAQNRIKQPPPQDPQGLLFVPLPTPKSTVSQGDPGDEAELGFGFERGSIGGSIGGAEAPPARMAKAVPPEALASHALLNSSFGPSLPSALSEALDQAYRLGDYMSRAQQLVTILAAQGRATPQVQEAMRRMDWPAVQSNAARAAKAIAATLQTLRDQLERPEPEDALGRSSPAPSRPEGELHA